MNISKIVNNYLSTLWHDAADQNNKILIDSIKPAKKAKVLDIGTYRGELFIERVKNIGQPDLYSVDIDKKALASCKKFGIKEFEHDIENGLPFKSNFFDIVCVNQVIEHLVHVDLLAYEIYRVLKAGGYALLSTENLSSWHNIAALLLGWQAFSQHISTNKHIGNPMRNGAINQSVYDTHIKIFTLKGLRELTELYNLKTENVFGAGYYPLPPFIAHLFSKLDPTHAAFIGLKVRKRGK